MTDKGSAPRRDSILCQLGWHAPQKGALWNEGYYFTRCGRCGSDLVRTTFSGWEAPRGYRIVWKGRAEDKLEPVPALKSNEPATADAAPPSSPPMAAQPNSQIDQAASIPPPLANAESLASLLERAAAAPMPSNGNRELSGRRRDAAPRPPRADRRTPLADTSVIPLGPPLSDPPTAPAPVPPDEPQEVEAAMSDLAPAALEQNAPSPAPSELEIPAEAEPTPAAPPPAPAETATTEQEETATTPVQDGTDNAAQIEPDIIIPARPVFRSRSAIPDFMDEAEDQTTFEPAPLRPAGTTTTGI